jgi:hypothetical protein
MACVDITLGTVLPSAQNSMRLLPIDFASALLHVKQSPLAQMSWRTKQPDLAQVAPFLPAYFTMFS